MEHGVATVLRVLLKPIDDALCIVIVHIIELELEELLYTDLESFQLTNEM